MIIKTDDYQIEFIDESYVVIKGTLRLQSPNDYSEIFEDIKKGIEQAKNKDYN